MTTMRAAAIARGRGSMAVASTRNCIATSDRERLRNAKFGLFSVGLGFLLQEDRGQDGWVDGTGGDGTGRWGRSGLGLD